MRDFSLRPLSHRFLVAPRSGFRTTVSPTYQPQKKKQNKTKQKRPAMQPGQGKRGQFGVNNSVVAGVPFPSRARILPSPNLVSRVLSWRRDART